jgi:NAD+ synthase (glutamine-hydrolysing)
MTPVATLPFRIALAQCRLIVGDLAGNAQAVRRVAADAQAGGAQLVAFPEMTIPGYPPEDLVLRRSFSAACEETLFRLAKDLDADGLGELPAYVGYLRRTDAGAHNSAAVLHRGAVAVSTDKVYLPNYGVFDEDRYFLAGSSFAAVTVAGVRVGADHLRGPVVARRPHRGGRRRWRRPAAVHERQPLRAGQGRLP